MPSIAVTLATCGKGNRFTFRRRVGDLAQSIPDLFIPPAVAPMAGSARLGR